MLIFILFVIGFTTDSFVISSTSESIGTGFTTDSFDISSTSESIGTGFTTDSFDISSTSDSIGTGFTTEPIVTGFTSESDSGMYKSEAIASDWESYVIERLGLQLDEDEMQEILDYLSFRAEHRLCGIQVNEIVLNEFGFLDPFEIVTLLRFIHGETQSMTVIEAQSASDTETEEVILLEQLLHILQHFIDFREDCVSDFGSTGGGLKNLRRSLPAISTENRVQHIVQEAVGYQEGRYAGSPLRYQDRYMLQGSNFTAHLSRSKSAGERSNVPFNTGFQSYHLAFSPAPGWYILLGDYTMQTGSGLHSSRGTMSTGSRNIQRLPASQSSIRPYRSGSSGRFYRGGVARYTTGYTQIHAFVSERKLSATPIVDEESVTGYRMPGWTTLRRTAGELERYQNVSIRSFGSGIQHSVALLNLSINTGFHVSRHRFSDDILPRNGLAYMHQFKGRDLMQWSTDVHVRASNWQGYSELSGSLQGGIARVHGLHTSSRKADSGIWFRSYDRDHYSIFGSGMGTFNGSANERGWGAWVVLRPKRGVRVRMYADRYASVGARPDADAGVWGWERGAAADVRAGLGVMLRAEAIFRGGLSGVWMEDAFGRVERVRMERDRATFRSSVRVEPGEGWMWQGRAEVQVLRGVLPDGGVGRLGGAGVAQVVRYRNRHGELIVQQVLFNADTHDTRVYAYEYDLHNVIRIPSFSGEGQRYSAVVQLNPAPWLLIRGKVGVTRYNDRFSIGTGNDMTIGPSRMDTGIQVITRF